MSVAYSFNLILVKVPGQESVNYARRFVISHGINKNHQIQVFRKTYILKLLAIYIYVYACV